MNSIIQFILLVILVLLACTKITLQGYALKKYAQTKTENTIFNIIFFLFIAIFMVLLFRVTAVDKVTVILAVAAAVTSVIYQVTYGLALTSGPVSMTSLLVSMNIFITIIFGIVFYKEKVYTSYIIGTVLLVVSMILNRNKSGESVKGNKKWSLLVILSTVSCGLASCIMKYYSLLPIENKSTSTFLVILYLSGSLLIFAGLIIKNKPSEAVKAFKGLKPGIVLFSALTGLSLCLYQKLNMYCMENIDATYMFPIHSGLQALFMTIIGIVFFKDRLSKRQKVSLAICIASIILMNTKF